MGIVSLALTLGLPWGLGKVTTKRNISQRMKLTSREWMTQLAKLALCCLVFVAAGQLYETMDAKPNFFKELGVPRHSTRAEIRKLWKGIILTSHPDKVHDMGMAEAEQRFNDLKEMYNTLLNDDERWVYDRLGESFFARPNHLEAVKEPASMAFFHLPEYILMMLISYAYGASAQRVAYRVYVITGVLLVLFWEVMITYGDGWWEPPLWFIDPYMTASQKTGLLRLLLPCIMHAMYTLSDSTYYDIAKHRHDQLLNRNLVIMERLDEEPWKKSRGEGADAGPKPRNWRADLKKLKKEESEQLMRDLQLQQVNAGRGMSMGSMIQLGFLAMMIYNNVFAGS